MTSVDEVLKKLSAAGIRRIKLGATDMDGVLRGKYISLEKFTAAASSHLGFCDVIFGWDIGDVLYDNATYTGWHTGYPDAVARVDLGSMRVIPWEPNTAFFLLDFERGDGTALPISPRQVLQRVVERARLRGFGVSLAAEYEFWCFRETPQSLRAKNFHDLTPVSPGMFGYSVLRASQNSPLVLDMMDQLAAFDIPLEGFHTETGPGVYEAAIAVDEGVAAADKAALFKTAVKEIAARHNVTPTFMAKWNADLPGSSGHIHQSLSAIGDHRNLFFENGGPSRILTGYIGGLCAHLPDLMAMIGGTVNSYKRTVPGLWAPINASWGVDNRTTAVRSIMGSPKSTRIELRLSAADMNPYLAMAASIAAGLEGVEHAIEPPPAAINAYDAAKSAPLPADLAKATDRFECSTVARDWFGDEFVDHYVCTRRWEIRQYQRAVTDWELARYFESV
jgi:glutamine synthetase